MDIDPVGVYLLGAFRIERNGKPIRLPTRKVESLLAYLVLHPGAQPREILATLFWGDSAHEEARRSLRQALTTLRNQINKELIHADRESVQINPSFPLWVDVQAFQEQAQVVLNDPSMAAKPFDSDLCPGDLLPDLYDDWILPLREHYRGFYIDVMLRSIELLRARSEYALAIEYAQQILEMDAANERAHQHLMFCYVTTGERNKALGQYEACQRALQDELDVEPARETQGLYNWIKETVTSIPSWAAKITNLPIPLSSFVGRGRELSEIKRLLSGQRLVTLSGAGGSGKTRLAIHAATDLIDSYRDGVWWVELAPLSDASLVAHAVARALGMEVETKDSVLEAIARYLRNRQVLLVLDNCEHLIEASAQVAEALLKECEGVKILATSREALGVMGEQVWMAPTLTVPKDGEINLVDLVMGYEAVQLFVERTRAVRSDYALTEMDALVVVQICQRLDGIPLAIELAAARMKMMSAGQIASRLDDRFGLLSRGARTAERRHQTLRAAVDWSYELLSDEERQFFNRLSAFAGGWTLESAEAICAGEGIEVGRILDLLSILVDKSLVRVDGSGERYTMLETMKAYGLEKLAESGKQEWMLELHLEHFLGLAETADEKIRGAEQLIWLERLRLERDNLNGAMEWSLSHPITIDEGVRLVCAMTWYWGMVGDFIIARYWLEKALSTSKELGRTARRASILFHASFQSALGFDWLSTSEQQYLLEESLGIWNELGMECSLERAQSLLALGLILKRDLYDDRGFDLLHESIRMFRAKNQIWWEAWALNCSLMMDENASLDEIQRVLDEESALWKIAGDRHGLANTLMDSATLALAQGNLSEAENKLQESLSIFRGLDSKGYIFQILRCLGSVKLGLNQYENAERYYQESIPYARAIGWDSALPSIYWELGFIALHKNDPEEAEKYLSQSLMGSAGDETKERIVLCVAGFACLAVVLKNQILAARLFGAYCAQQDAFGDTSRRPLLISRRVNLDEIEHSIESCRQQLGDEEYERVWNSGQALSLDNVVEEIHSTFQEGQ